MLQPSLEFKESGPKERVCWSIIVCGVLNNNVSGATQMFFVSRVSVVLIYIYCAMRYGLQTEMKAMLHRQNKANSFRYC